MDQLTSSKIQNYSQKTGNSTVTIKVIYFFQRNVLTKFSSHTVNFSYIGFVIFIFFGLMFFDKTIIFSLIWTQLFFKVAFENVALLTMN